MIRASKSFVAGVGLVGVGLAAAALLLTGCAGEQSILTHIPDSAPVATVDGRTVLYEDVKVDSHKIETLFQRRRGHSPNSRQDWEEVSQMQRLAERENLIQVIRGLVRERQYAQWGIMVDEAQIEREIESRSQRTGLDPREAEAMVDRQIQQTEDLIAAVEAVRDDRMSLEEARREYLSEYDELTSQYWSNYYAQRPADEQIKVLRRAQAQLRTEGAGAFLRPLVERDLRGQQVQRRLEEELAKVYPDYKQVSVDAKHGSDSARDRLAAMRSEWWSQRFQDAQVEILHPRFEGDWEEVVYDKADEPAD